ncbi:AAA family ATPase [Streptomyces hygroscopicus]|uniref:AAA family ATPase n=1 Tax=Streptomyces hygroscopicus TaxID=1912 RepID=UPI0036402457
MDRTDGRLLGRERESEQIHALLTNPDGPRLVLVRGERGVGRSAFLHAVGERLRAQGTAVHSVDCVPGDDDRPLLLALRLVMALEKHRSAGERQPPTAGPVARALSAVDQRDQAALEALLHAAVTRGAPVVVLVDDAQHGDPDSLAMLGRIEWPPGSGVRLVVSAVRHFAPSAEGTEADALPTAREDTSHRGLNTEGARAPGGEGATGTMDRLAGVAGAPTIVLTPLGPDDTTRLVGRWIQAKLDGALARQTAELTRGVPGAIDALLTGWTGRGEIRIADGHAFIGARAPVPVLPEDDRFVTALDRLGEPAGAVASALSILGPLGWPALGLTAAWTGLTSDAVGDGVRRLVESDIIEELPGQDGITGRGWTFRLPLTAHTVRERLGPVERGRLSAMAVEILWKDPDLQGAGTAISQSPGDPDETNALTYLADRIADAGSLVDRERAVAELTAAARRIPPGADDGRVLRWLRAARDLTEHATARDLVLQQYGKASYVAGDYSTGRSITEALLRNPGHALSALALQETACQFVALTANQQDWQALSRLATKHWWDELPVPAAVKASGQALALCRLARWQEAWELLSRTQPLWNTGPADRAAPMCFKAVAELALGRPEAFRRELAMEEAPELAPDTVYGLTAAMFDELAVDHDLTAATTLLDSRTLTAPMLPPLSQFLHHHLTGRWDQALELARQLLSNPYEVQTSGSDSYLLPARTAAILLARGRITSALNMVESSHGPEVGPPRWSMRVSEAEALRTLGDLEGAEKTLRRGLDTAQAHAQIYATGELRALLAEVTADAGRAADAAAHLRALERIAAETGSGRARLRHLLASARVLRQEVPETAREHLREAVDLARLRGLPFETAITLLAAAETGAGPATLLYEAYELFGLTGATLWRSHTRTALREAGLTVPGRKQATAENEHLLATLIAEGLTNRQIATVLRLSEDAAAQRLSRLFARTGMRSRTEVVTAVHTGSL